MPCCAIGARACYAGCTVKCHDAVLIARSTGAKCESRNMTEDSHTWGEGRGWWEGRYGGDGGWEGVFSMYGHVAKLFVFRNAM